jgi:predicted nucleotidyltransferase
MDSQLVDALNKYKQNLEVMGIKVQRMIIYGSHATDTTHKESDIDLIIVSDDLKDLDLWERLTLLGRARIGIHYSMDIRGITEREYQNSSPGTFLHDEVIKKGVVL